MSSFFPNYFGINLEISTSRSLDPDDNYNLVEMLIQINKMFIWSYCSFLCFIKILGGSHNYVH